MHAALSGQAEAEPGRCAVPAGHESTSRDPVRARARVGHWALSARTMPEAGRRKVFEARLPVSDWPAKALKVTAVERGPASSWCLIPLVTSAWWMRSAPAARCLESGRRSPSGTAVSWTAVCAR